MRVAVIGPQNTGKSTFIRDFSDAFPQFKVPTETYRDLIRKKNLSVNQLTGTESQRLIRDFIAGQVERAEGDTIFDRCLIDNYVYTLYAFLKGNIEQAFMDETREMLLETVDDIDLYFFIPSTLAVPLEDDSLRDTNPAYVDAINRLFIDTLFMLTRERIIPVVTIGGTREERVADAASALSAFGLKSPAGEAIL